MNDVQNIQSVMEVDFMWDVIMNPAEYPDEVLAVAIDGMKDVSRQLYEARVRVENTLIDRMKRENATKLDFLGKGGQRFRLTLKSGSMTCTDKTADEIYRGAGFDPLEIGEYVFKPSWSKAKEARKFGGDKQIIIDDLFKAGNPSLDIKEVE